jgi:hypothetical protein
MATPPKLIEKEKTNEKQSLKNQFQCSKTDVGATSKRQC